MKFCDEQTYEDLEFDELRNLLIEFAVSETVKNNFITLKPLSDKAKLLTYLQQVHELVAIRQSGQTFPRLEFEELKNEIRLLQINGSVLAEKSFFNILLASHLGNDLIKFFKTVADLYPELSSLLDRIYFTDELIKSIEKIFDKKGKVKDDASPELLSIRQRIVSLERQIHRNFDKELRKLERKGLLSDTKESFTDNKRTLAVLSTHKREVPGVISGSSKSGNVTYIEPLSNVPLNFEKEQLIDDERKEIFKILKVLTAEISIHIDLIKGYQQVLTAFDFINAKSRLALKLDACLPGINNEKVISLKRAYHPILKLSYEKQGKPVIPQDINFAPEARMLVISGPNAGGKSITLKTVGLLQLMLQCGLLIPVHPNSTTFLFDRLLSDIGDNQSIENELSTYSYRLTRMRKFLQVADENSLLLLDEFGTGSDPDLGGALAEVFLEELYEKGSYAVITTHYGNIKLRADKLPHAINGCMLFNTETLQPMFKFSIGQPGSSFTFEVAQMNGIPKKIIQKAKTKLDGNKVRMDKLLAELQKEKSYLSKLNKAHIEAQEIADEARQYFESSKKEYDEKIINLRERAKEDDKYVSLGKKLQGYINDYKTRSKKKNVNAPLLEEIKKYIAREKSKIEEVKQAEILKKKQAQQSKIKKTNKTGPNKDAYNQSKVKVGSTVKVIATKQKGIVEEIKGTEVTVAFGFARMKIDLSKLMWLEG
jgi:DNA mismatch repair protein MutS2